LYTLVILLGRLKPKDCKFAARLDYVETLSQKIKTKQNKMVKIFCFIIYLFWLY
jgi:hypothetical protein